MLRKHYWTLFVIGGALATAALIAACKSTPEPDHAQEDGIYNPYGVPVDRLFEIRSVATSKDAGAKCDVSKIPGDSIYIDDRPVSKDVDGAPGAPPSKISPILLNWMSTRASSDKVDLLVTFREDLRIPRLPELGPGEVRGGRGKTRCDAAIEALKAQRADSQARSLKQLSELGDLKVMETFWIANCAKINTVLGQVERFSTAENVVYLQPAEGGEPPPQDGNNNNDAEDARAVIVSDPYFGLQLTSPWIGLLDTGVRDTHQMFNQPDNLDWLRDCVNGGANCNDTANANFNTGDFAWNHGTSSAGILVGNGRRGAAFRGVTEIRMDSWQIYTAQGLDSAAAVRAIQAAVAAFDRVLVGEIQAIESETGAIATAADNAYDAGAIFVSANGNFGPNASTVRSPGIAHKVLGVGAFFTDGGAQYDDQGRGPATDSRFKPDIQAPTRSETASNASDTALREFGGTSGATPYASAVAMLSRNWLRQFGTWDNGQTYAFMILYGQREWPYDNTEGAGRLVMATNGHAWWGKITVSNHQNVDIPINFGSRRNLDASLWWPETAAQAHNDIDIHLIDPSGVERAKGFSSASVFERTGVGGTLASGNWTIRIRGFNVPTGSQTVYWAVHAQN